MKRLLTYLADHPVDALFSDGPPHSNTRIATLVSQRTGLPWLADFQDPWTQVDYYGLLKLTRWGRRRHERMEQEALQQASLTTIVGPSWKKELEAIGARNVRVLYWGYDPEDFSGLERNPHRKFTLTHLGIMGYDRHPEVLFAAITQLNRDVPEFAHDFELRLYGQVDHRVRASLAAYGLLPQVSFCGNVDRRVALQETVDSHVLLLLLNQQPNARGRIPGKLFEYLAARNPVLNIGPVDSDVADILTETGCGQTFDYSTAPAHPARYLLELYRQFKGGKSLRMQPTPLIERYSHPRLVAQLATYLDEIIA
nr:hypothetical protein [Neolewinella maritima]